ncbi:hypothetical protein [Streptomyces mesophilus]|uniref:hypothetical protein n=1 Tax=Streptomyces mesophilus TaxID=1775132 RepID=UPI0033211E9C
MNVNDLVQQRIEAARHRIATTRRTRAELTEARTRGLTHRHTHKLRTLAQREHAAERPTSEHEAGASPIGPPGESERSGQRCTSGD